MLNDGQIVSPASNRKSHSLKNERTHLEPLWVSRQNQAHCCSLVFSILLLAHTLEATFGPSCWLQKGILGQRICQAQSDCRSSSCFVWQGVEDVWGSCCRQFHHQRRCLMPQQRAGADKIGRYLYGLFEWGLDFIKRLLLTLFLD